LRGRWWPSTLRILREVDIGRDEVGSATKGLRLESDIMVVNMIE
jgi:hypothetical protein